MRNVLSAVFFLAVFAGCSGSRRAVSRPLDVNNYPGKPLTGALPGFALPGVPAKNDLPQAAEGTPVNVDSAAVAAPEAKPAAPAEDSGDLKFHLAAADKYSAGKKYRSAAAEYGAALGFLPEGDARAVRLLERQGAMMLKVRREPAAREYFRAAIKKAGDLNTTGDGLADAYLGLGYCLRKEKNIPEAITNYEKALELTDSGTVKAKISATIDSLKKSLPASGQAGN
jgi:tetratricopeptide (TPR) repeat protein